MPTHFSTLAYPSLWPSAASVISYHGQSRTIHVWAKTNLYISKIYIDSESFAKVIYSQQISHNLRFMSPSVTIIESPRDASNHSKSSTGGVSNKKNISAHSDMFTLQSWSWMRTRIYTKPESFCKDNHGMARGLRHQSWRHPVCLVVKVPNVCTVIAQKEIRCYSILLKNCKIIMIIK